MDRWDGIALLGLVMVGVGLWYIYWPLALIVPGAALVGLGIGGARRGKRPGPPRPGQ